MIKYFLFSSNFMRIKNRNRSKMRTVLNFQKLYKLLTKIKLLPKIMIPNNSHKYNINNLSKGIRKQL